VAAALAACGGGTPPGTDAVTASAQAARVKPPPTPPPGTGEFNGGVADPGLLMMLLPDNLAQTDARVGAWRDAAVESGVRLAPITDTQFLSLGTKALAFGGLVLPDDMHTYASDAVVEAVRSYVSQGGRAMLTFDFGALTKTADGVPVYAVPRSRLSDLAGVDYVLYDELRERTTGVGPVVATRSVMRQLQVPPGKSMPYPQPPPPTAPAGAQAPQAASVGASPAGPRYLPVSIDDPGGVHAFDPAQFHGMRLPSVQERLRKQLRARVAIDWGKARVGAPVAGVTRATPVPAAVVPVASRTAAAEGALAPQAATLDPLHAYSGYLIGHLVYPSYVTRGDYGGAAIAVSPDFGLIAGVRSFGAGRVLFVNLPLTYLKGRTDALPLHGFLRYFALELGQAAHVSAMPNGVPGLTFNWHLDSTEAQQPSLDLEQQGLFAALPSSMHITAGPDTITPGDGLGWNLNNNLVAQDLLRRLAASGQDVGNHGGWIHDYYGSYASETNQAEFEPYLELNRQAVDGLLGRPSRSYSAPEGNNPLWAMDWLERQGVVAAYFLGHTGVGPTRHYRDGVLRNPNLFVFPVTPQGWFATFEEWQYFGVPKEEVTGWLHELVDFSVQFNTNRLVYAHPPGAVLWPDVLQDMLAYAAAQGPERFRWYTMPVLASHLLRRLGVSWKQEALANGDQQFTATHASNLSGVAWRLPKARYAKPVVTSGSASVADGGTHWLVRASGTKSLVFTAKPV
jgi:hypothetical protein